MSSRSVHLTALGLVALLVFAVGCQRSTSVPAGAAMPTVTLGEAVYRITGPYVHEGVSVYLLHSDNQDQADYVTLDQGLKDGTVVVTEKAEGEVQALLIDNRGEKPLFLQEGDRVQGGKQDRTLYSSLVVPAKSGEMPIPTFCIEQGRWAAGSKGQAFDATANAGLAPKDVRQAAKVNKNQQDVWEVVAGQKREATAQLATPNTNSSLNEALDAPEVKKLADSCAEALTSKLSEHPDAVGVAIVVNGQVEEVNVYPNHQLLQQLYPRLVGSYALQATLEKDKAKDAPTCTVADVIQFMTEGKKRTAQPAEQINRDNRLCVENIDDKKYQCSTEYDGKPVHTQFMRKSEMPSSAPGRQAPGQQLELNDNRQQGGRGQSQQPSQPPAPPNPPAQPPAPPSQGP